MSTAAADPPTRREPAAGDPTLRRLGGQLFAALSSFALTIVVLSFLFLLTIIGTLEQTNSSLFEVQAKYFESLFVIHQVGRLPVPLPGVYLLLVVLSINLICGGIIRIRKARMTAGVIVAHVGILTMVAGAGVEYWYSQKGHTTMPEGAVANEFVSYYEWEIAIAEQKGAGPVVEHTIPGAQFMDLKSDARATFGSPEIPFELAVHDVRPNCEAVPAGIPIAEGAPVVDGFALAELPRNKEAEADAAGVYVTVTPRSGGAATEGILWAHERFPMSVVADGRRFTIELTHRRFPLPFSVRLDDFRRDMHPGTGMAKAFESDVTKLQDGAAQKVKISMNEPLNQDGYKLFQSGFQEPSAGGRGRWWSTFSVVKNPADSVPLWSCIIITLGLLLHFSQKLARHVGSQTRSRQ